MTLGQSTKRFHFRVRTLFCLLLVLSLDPRGYSPGTPVFLSPQKLTFPNSNSTRNLVDEEPLCGCATSKSLFIYLFILLSSSNSMTFSMNLPSFPWPQVQWSLSKLLLFWGDFFYHTQFSIHNLVSTKRVSFALTNQQYLSHFVLALTLQ